MECYERYPACHTKHIMLFRPNRKFFKGLHFFAYEYDKNYIVTSMYCFY